VATETVKAADHKLLAAGEWSETGEWSEIRSPYDESVVGRVAQGDEQLVNKAIEAAQEAFEAGELSQADRAAILDRASHIVAERTEELGVIIAAEAGKPLKTATLEATRCADTLMFSAVEARKLTGQMVPMDATQAGEGKLAFTIRSPVGVVGAITPFNFPLNLVAHKLAPALAAGCPVVLKPAAQTPLSALLLAEIELEAGLPAGWLSVVIGPSSEIGDVLVEDERVRALTFTGSGSVGWALRARAPRKRVLLELGNSTPAIVDGHADVEAAAASLAANAFSFAGQSCISVQRIYVERTVYDRFLDSFLGHVGDLVVGDPADEDTDVGPVIDETARERILAWLEKARKAGARILAGGDLDGELIRPTVVADADPELEVNCEEVFGPVCTVTPFDTLDEAIALANGTRYGLQAGIFTSKLDVAMRAARELDFRPRGLEDGLRDTFEAMADAAYTRS